jgi:hypothetical protein
MTTTQVADWLYASDFMAQVGDEAPNELVRQNKASYESWFAKAPCVC